MAKRRNLKKEKALRNEAYARKFRKRNNSRFGRRQYNQNRQSDSSDDNNDNNSTDNSNGNSNDNSSSNRDS
ncbi:MAG: hypothetical protein AAF289_20005 [Cyanobacteria bacterium P01_A01_bin.135]